MYYTIATIYAGLMVLWGIVLLTGRKFMVCRGYVSIGTFFIVTLNPTIELMKMGSIIYPIIIGIPVFILGIVFTKDKFTLTNMNLQMVLPILTDFLNDEGISFEKENKALVLNDYDNKRITYTQSLNSVEIDFVDIKDFLFYKEFKIKLRGRIKEDSIRLFPSSGVFYVISGGVFAIVLQYLQSRF